MHSLKRSIQFTAPDLSEFARRLDALEQSSRYDDATRGNTSTNMDDTGSSLAFSSISNPNNSLGFFSVQVLEEALNIFGLTFVTVAFHSDAAPYTRFIIAWFAGVLKL